jgi:hypothetical protein
MSVEKLVADHIECATTATRKVYAQCEGQFTDERTEPDQAARHKARVELGRLMGLYDLPADAEGTGETGLSHLTNEELARLAARELAADAAERGA